MSNYEIDTQGNKQYFKSTHDKKRNINGIYYNTTNKNEKGRGSSGVSVNMNSKVDYRSGTSTRGNNQKKYGNK